MYPGPAYLARWLMKILADAGLWRPAQPDRPPAPPTPEDESQFTTVYTVTAQAVAWHPAPADAAYIHALASWVMGAPQRQNVIGGMLP